MPELVALNGAKIGEPPATAHPEVVAHLERLLELARGGQVTQFAFISAGPHAIERGYAGCEEYPDCVQALGLLSRLAHLLQTHADQIGNPVTFFPGAPQ